MTTSHGRTRPHRIPLALTLCGLAAASRAAVNLTWTAPVSNTDGSKTAVAGYRVYQASTGGAMLWKDVGPTTSTPLEGFTAGVTYVFYVTAYGADGVESPLSAAYSWTAPRTKKRPRLSDPEPDPTPDPTPDPAPEPVPTTTQVTLSWLAPAQHADGSAIRDLTGYRVYMGLAGSEPTQVQQLGLVTTTTVTGLVADVEYAFAVTAVNSAGTESPLSQPLSWRAPSAAATTLPAADTDGATGDAIEAGALLAGDDTSLAADLEPAAAPVPEPPAPTAPPTVTGFGLKPEGFVLRWASTEGSLYRIDFSASLTEPFQTIASNVAATPPENSCVIDVQGAPSGFFRVGRE